jgi:hypothetical protein
MKIVRKTISALVLIGLLASTLLFNGCGRQEAVSEGCPADSFAANSTDILSGPADDTFVTAPCVPANIYIYPPLIFSVTDANNNPKNNVCIVLYTDGNWFADNTYTSLVTGVGSFNRIVAVTDDSGRSKSLYWGTYLLPASNPLKSSGTGTAISFTAGADQSGVSFVTAESGLLSKTFKSNWTVKGCQP